MNLDFHEFLRSSITTFHHLTSTGSACLPPLDTQFVSILLSMPRQSMGQPPFHPAQKVEQPTFHPRQQVGQPTYHHIQQLGSYLSVHSAGGTAYDPPNAAYDTLPSTQFSMWNSTFHPRHQVSPIFHLHSAKWEIQEFRSTNITSYLLTLLLLLTHWHRLFVFYLRGVRMCYIEEVLGCVILEG